MSSEPFAIGLRVACPELDVQQSQRAARWGHKPPQYERPPNRLQAKPRQRRDLLVQLQRMQLRLHVFHSVVHDASDSIKAGTYTVSLNILKRDGY